MQIELHPDLKVGTPRSARRATFLDSLSSVEYEKSQGYGRPKLKQKARRRIDLPEGDDVVLHKSYYEYVAACYSTHHGVVVAPHHLWYLVLTEVSGHVKANADHYRDLFTSNPEGKTDITVMGNVDTVEMSQFTQQLLGHVPVDVGQFLPEFSTSTPGYEAAAACAFMDAVSPYYSYSMMLCGIPKIRLEGTREDWARFARGIGDLKAMLDLANEKLDAIGTISQKILDTFDNGPDIEWWDSILLNENCGSGGQVKFTGWLTEFIFEPSGFLQLCNFPSAVSCVTIKQVETQVNYQFLYGLFSSTLSEDNWLEPAYGMVAEEES